MLEEIENEQSVGYFITTVYRNDPNISIRHEIYEKTIHEIQNHPVTGIGWGSIASVLGTDERGAGLNASNVFLEIWLGSGLIGLIAFAIVWFGAAIQAGVRLFRNRMPDEEPLLLFVLSAWAGITVFNLFNSGILLGFFFLFLSLTAFILQLSPRKTKLS
jgi:O-antigen ligase